MKQGIFGTKLLSNTKPKQKSLGILSVRFLLLSCLAEACLNFGIGIYRRFKRSTKVQILASLAEIYLYYGMCQAETVRERTPPVGQQVLLPLIE